MKTPRTMLLTMILLGLGGAALLVYLLAQHGIGDIATAVAAARWGLLAVIVFHLIPLFLDVLGWQVLFPPGHRPSAWNLFWMRWVGESVSALLPVAQVGGDIVRIRLVAVRSASLPVAVATVVAGITLSVVTQIVFTLSGLMLLLALTGTSGLTRPVLAGSLIAALVMGVFYTIQHVGLFRLMTAIFSRIAQTTVGQGFMQHATAWDQELRNVYARRGDLLFCSLYTMGNWATGAAEMWIALWALGVHTGYAQAYILESMGQGIRSAAFLVPGALGVQEGGYLVVGALLGIPANTILAVALIRRARELAYGIPGIIGWQIVEGRRLWRRPVPVESSTGVKMP